MTSRCDVGGNVGSNLESRFLALISLTFNTIFAFFFTFDYIRVILKYSAVDRHFGLASDDISGRGSFVYYTLRFYLEFAYTSLAYPIFICGNATPVHFQLF